MAYWASEGAEHVSRYIADRDDPKSTSKDNQNFRQLLTLLGGMDQLVLLYKTISELSRIGHRMGTGLDLHPGNFMLGSDGTVVISDPFFNGY
jgi:hypothetical protein